MNKELTVDAIFNLLAGSLSEGQIHTLTTAYPELKDVLDPNPSITIEELVEFAGRANAHSYYSTLPVRAYNPETQTVYRVTGFYYDMAGAELTLTEDKK